MSTDLQQARCAICNATSSPLWRRNEEDAVVCLECHTNKKAENDKCTATGSMNFNSSSCTENSINNAPKKKKNNKKTKMDRGGRINSSSLANTVYKASYRGRRSLTKETPIKSPVPEPMVLTTSSVLYKGVAYEIGDVVSVLDYSGGTYYAIIRGLLVDQYSEKYAVLTWVLPKLPNPVEFDPFNFILGPEEEQPRSLETLEFVCHSPRSCSFEISSQYDVGLLNLWISPALHPPTATNTVDS